jgi:DNA-binding CsgD family transcriptional regulator
LAAPFPSLVRAAAGSDDVRALLSARQREIMDLVARGLTNKEIAQQLGLTDGTVKQHLAAIFPKLGVRNRTWAVAMWHQASPETAPSDAAGPRAIGGAAPGLPGYGQAELASSGHGTGSGSGDRHGLREAGAGQPLADSAVVALPSRLVASVAVALPASDGDAHGDRSGASLQVAGTIIAACRAWAAVFEGDLRVDGARCVMVTFGYPRAHLDDVDRAVAFAETVRSDLRTRRGIAVRIGIDAGQDALCLCGDAILMSQTAWNSLMLVVQAEDDSVVLTPRTQRLLPSAPDGAGAVPPGASTWADLFARAPFVREAEAALAHSRISWFAVEAWPLPSAKHLLDAWQTSPVGTKTQQVVLRMPSAIDGDVEQVLLEQLRAQLPALGRAKQRAADLGWWLHALAQEGPLSVLVYGWHETTTFAALLSAAALDELANCPVVFLLGPQAIPGAPRLMVRSLDSRGRKPLVGKVHETALHDQAGDTSSYCPDIVALCDQIDTPGQKVLGLVLQYRRCTPQFLSHQLELSGAALDQRLDRLVGLGLVAQWPDGSIRLRDLRTETALRHQLSDMPKVI